MSKRFGIISPYKSQLRHMRACFSRAFGPSALANMEFSTVDGFQGREVDILILSTVRAAESNRSSSIGFVADARRMNVALTRAKLSLWIFGNSRTLQINRSWAALVRDAEQRNLVILIKIPCGLSRMTDDDYENLIKNGTNNDTVLQSSLESSKSESSVEHVPAKRPLAWTSSNRISSCPSKRRIEYIMEE
ncbi:helicase SEN1-like [Mercurialis annua]|uniref:helicase SEN1-like n=1 Tax=Mercurialis annua TaxID=3986 RepID=UPI0024AEC404|nr:helicase SEN1-like [Mercurialis annua]